MLIGLKVVIRIIQPSYYGFFSFTGLLLEPIRIVESPAYKGTKVARSRTLIDRGICVYKGYYSPRSHTLIKAITLIRGILRRFDRTPEEKRGLDRRKS